MKISGGGGGGGGCKPPLPLILQKNLTAISIQFKQNVKPEISPNDIDSSTLLILIVFHRLMICESTMKENSFVSPYNVILVRQYSLIASSVSVILPQITCSCLFLALQFPAANH